MTDHATTNPPGPGNPPSSTSPADAGGAVQVAVPPAGRWILTVSQARMLDLASARTSICVDHRSTAMCDRLVRSGYFTGGFGFYSITDAGRARLRLLKEGK